MNAFIIVALALAAPSLCAPSYNNWAAVPANIALSSDGKNVLDTPEVAHARAAHLAALQQAQAASGPDHGQDDGSYDSRWENESHDNGQYNAPAQQQWSAPAQQWNAPAPQWNAAPAQQQWSGPAQQQWSGPAQQQWSAPAQQWNAKPTYAPANIALSKDGQYVLDTPEVAQARAAHLAAYAGAGAAAPAAHAPQWNAAPAQQWSAPAQQWNAPAPQWNAAPAPAWNAAPGHGPAPVADTPEVAQAKAAHAAAYSAAQRAAAANPDPAAHGQQWNGAPSWHSAPAAPVNNWAAAPAHNWGAPAPVADTPEVAQAKAAHAAALAAASAHSAPAPAHHW